MRFEPVSVEIARVAGSLEDPAPGDPADQLILATAKTLGAKLITADERLRASPHAAAVW